jgi:hypothetical protein
MVTEGGSEMTDLPGTTDPHLHQVGINEVPYPLDHPCRRLPATVLHHRTMDLDLVEDLEVLHLPHP